MISFGSKAVTGMYYGAKAVTAAYYGDKLVWSGEEPRAVKFTALEDSGLSVQSYGSAPSITLEYSLDGRTWNPMTVNETVISVDAGDYCYVRGVGNGAWNPNSDAQGNKFRGTGSFKLAGPIETLLDKDATGITADNAFQGVFRECTMKLDLRDLQFPDTTSYRCFAQTFAYSRVTAAPNALPAKAPAMDAYVAMFYNCPDLSDASNLKFGFENASRGNCTWMFNSDSNLTAAPVLPAITASTNESFDIMFQNCSKLAQLSVEFTSWPSM